MIGKEQRLGNTKMSCWAKMFEKMFEKMFALKTSENPSRTKHVWDGELSLARSRDVLYIYLFIHFDADIGLDCPDQTHSAGCDAERDSEESFPLNLCHLSISIHPS